MEETNNIRWTINQDCVIAPGRRYNKRNSSLPDLCVLNQHGIKNKSSKKQLKYNKWYIKPSERLKQRLNTQSNVIDKPKKYQNENFFYQDLYKPQKENHLLHHGIKLKKQSFYIEKISNDAHCIRTLNNFKHQKQEKERIPAIVEFIIQRHVDQDNEKLLYFKKKNRKAQ